MSNNCINSKIDTSNIIRRNSVRASKDKAIARIAIPFEDLYFPKKTVTRSKSVVVKKTCKAVDELDDQMSTLSIISNENDDDEEDFEDESDSSESSAQSSDDVDESDESTTTTPKLQRRKTFITSKTPVTTVNLKKTERKKMTATSFSENIPCRDNEFDQLYLSISTAIYEKRGSCIFVVGVPGTGKTATVSAVLDCLESEETLPDFTRISANGMHVTESREIYALIYKELTNKHVSKQRAVQCLEAELFKKSTRNDQRRSLVILIDEIDQLSTRKEDVLYKIFGWTQRAGSRLIVVAISNTMDLPERLSEHKVTSRSGLTSFSFQPYSHEQLLVILRSKMKKEGLDNGVDLKALEFTAKKVASASGDVRRILEIFRRLIELHKTGKKIDIPLVDFILKEMSANPNIAAIRDGCSYYEKMFLRSMLSTFRSCGLEEAVLKDVLFHLLSLCTMENVEMPSHNAILGIVVSLGSYKLINYESLNKDIHLRMRLNCPQENVNFALNAK